MTPEERELLQRSVKLAEDNNNMLRSINRSMKMARIMSVVYWVFIIGSAVGAYYLIQPYIDALVGAYGGVRGSIDSGVGGFSSYLDLLQ
ncbi:MAG: Uncharacterized protein CEO12_230 [Parcubacteria group bacterium Gr01-1014_46]|nr:MAG: Uncharacterized protein CEO12_230 [Parcubacteria group bacterium Gr01-1014_46]